MGFAFVRFVDFLETFAMPYVRRDKSGVIIGHSITKQSEDTEFLPDDHPELVKYFSQFPPGFLTPPTPDEWRQIRTEQKRIDEEHEQIRAVTVAFNLRFSEPELALSALLYVVFNKPESHLAYAVYFSPTGFDARVEIVENSLLQIISENKALAELEAPWAKLRKRIDKSRNLRNAVAHSSPITHAIGGKKYARLSPPAFDVIRIGRVLANRQIPGLSLNDLRVGCHKLAWAHDRVDDVNRLVAAFHADDGSLPEKFRELEENLNKQDSP